MLWLSDYKFYLLRPREAL